MSLYDLSVSLLLVTGSFHPEATEQNAIIPIPPLHVADRTTQEEHPSLRVQIQTHLVRQRRFCLRSYSAIQGWVE